MTIAVIAFTAFCLAQIPHVSVDGDILRVYRNSGEMYDRYLKLQQTFGTFENDAYVLVKSPDMTDPSVLESLREMAFDLELTSYAAGTLSPFSLRKPTDDGGTAPSVPENMQTNDEVAKALTDLRDTDPMMRNLILDDLTGMVMILFPDPELTKGDGEAKMLAELKQVVSQYDSDKVDVELTGPPVWKTEMLDATVDDQIKFSVVGFVIGAVVSFICLRSFWGAILSTLTPFVSIIWLMGTVTASFGQFTFLTNIVAILVLVIGFAESMYFCFTWLRLWRDGMDPHEAITETVVRVTPAAALTTITTMVSFATLVAGPGPGHRGIRHFRRHRRCHHLYRSGHLPAAGDQACRPARVHAARPHVDCRFGADPGGAPANKPLSAHHRHWRRGHGGAVLHPAFRHAAALRLPGFPALGFRGAGDGGRHRFRRRRRRAALCARAAETGSGERRRRRFRTHQDRARNR